MYGSMLSASNSFLSKFIWLWDPTYLHVFTSRILSVIDCFRSQCLQYQILVLRNTEHIKRMLLKQWWQGILTSLNTLLYCSKRITYRKVENLIKVSLLVFFGYKKSTWVGSLRFPNCLSDRYLPKDPLVSLVNYHSSMFQCEIQFMVLENDLLLFHSHYSDRSLFLHAGI